MCTSGLGSRLWLMARLTADFHVGVFNSSRRHSAILAAPAEFDLQKIHVEIAYPYHRV